MQDAHDRERADAQAERWLARLQAGDCAPDERAAFARWRDASPAHAAAFERAERLYRRSGSLALRNDPLLQAAAREARIRTARAREHRAGWRRGLSLAAAASLLLAAGAFGWLSWNPAEPVQHYATRVGEKRIVRLSDGSTVLLDTASAIDVRFRRKQRELTLAQGQAEFSVASQPRRPFIVHAAGGSVRALGTRFQVRTAGGGAQVVLLEGKVRVSAPESAGKPPRSTELAPGDLLRYGPAGRWQRGAADLEVAQGWTRGELVFRNRPLHAIVAEMNRHTTGKLRLGDPSLRELPVSGVFYDNNQQSLVRALELGWSLRAERNAAGDIVLRSKERAR